MSSVCTVCEPRNTVLGFVLERDASLWLWIFSGHLQLTTAARVSFTALFFLLQRRNRSAVVSTVDYSCNIARKKCAPAAWTDCALSLVHPARRTAFRRQIEDLAASCSAPQTAKQSSTPTPESTFALPFLFPNIEECHRLRFISLSAG